MGNEEIKTMVEAFKQKSRPTNFLSGLFKQSLAWQTRTRTIEMDVVRDNEKIAIDVTPYTNGHLNVQKRFTSAEYNPPTFNEYNSYDSEELEKRIAGQNPYEGAGNNGMAALIAMITDDQVRQQALILRAMEKMASDVLFSGKITLVNDAQIDYKQKSALQIDATAAWGGGSEVIPADLEGLATAIRKYGKATMEDLIFGETAWKNFILSTSMKERFNYRRVDLNEIKAPVRNTEGAAFHGIIAIGAYTLRCWTYPQYYGVPSDAEIGVPSGTIANAGTSGNPYVPLTKVLGVGRDIDLRWLYGGISTLIDKVDPRMKSLFGLTRLPGRVAADFLPYAQVSDSRSKPQIIVGVESRPMPVPTQIDGFGWLETNP